MDLSGRPSRPREVPSVTVPVPIPAAGDGDGDGDGDGEGGPGGLPRTVNDFGDREHLREALTNMSLRSHGMPSHTCPFYETELDAYEGGDKNGRGGGEGSLPPDPDEADWVTKNVRPEASLPQSIDEEADRLMVLKSYLILDSMREPAFERLTGLAQRFFGAPIALVSLIDMGRQWFLSNRGLGDVRQTPRKQAFCAHAIQSTEDLLVVPDATTDPRFMHNGLVTGWPHIRFYAGAPLVCPEGYKLGTLCVIDTKTRPNGLSLAEKQTLTELAALVMEAMVNRRRDRLDLASDRARVMACMARDLMTPLEAAKGALVEIDGEGGGTPRGDTPLQSAMSALSDMDRICGETIRSFRSDLADITAGHRLPAGASALDEARDRPALPTVVVGDLLRSLRAALDSVCPPGTSAPIEICADPTLPSEFLSEGLKLHRAALHLLINAAQHTPPRDGGENFVRMRLYVKTVDRGGSSMLVFECLDTGTGVSPAQQSRLFTAFSSSQEDGSQDGDGCLGCIGSPARPGLGLYSVAVNVSSLKGRYGYRPRSSEGCDEPGSRPRGSIFWFAVPLVVSYSANEEGAAAPTLAPLRRSKKDKQKMISVAESDAYDPNAVRDAVNRAMEEGEAGAAAGPKARNEDTCGRGGVQSGSPQRALIIDDSIVIQKSIGRALKNLGFAVTCAADGMKGLQALQSQKYEVVFCDFLMPVLDGLDCIEQYRLWESKHRPNFHQTIVGLSAHASQNDVERGTKVGVNTFVSKSTKLKDMLKKATELSGAFSKEGGSAVISDAAVPGASGQSPPDAPNAGMPASILDQQVDRLATHPAYAYLVRGNGRLSHHSGSAKNRMDSVTALASLTAPVLPAMYAGLAAPQTTEAPYTSGGNLTPGDDCLIVVDSRAVTRALAKSIEDAGWTALVADGAHDALRLLKSKRWGAALVDENIPDMSKAHFISSFRSWEAKGRNRSVKQNNIFLIVDCSRGGEEDVAPSCPAGYDGVMGMRKPITSAQVAELLKKAAIRRHDREEIS